MNESDLFAARFRRLFDESFNSLYRYLDRLSGDPDLAADVTQEAFVRLHARHEIPDDPRAWLAAVGANLIRDEHRRSRRRLTLLTSQPEGLSVGAPPVATDEAVSRDDEKSRVRAVLDQMPLRDRQMLLLRHEGYSYREIATAVGVAEASVGTMLIRATEAFRTKYLECNRAPE